MPPVTDHDCSKKANGSTRSNRKVVIAILGADAVFLWRDAMKIATYAVNNKKTFGIYSKGGLIDLG